MSKDKQMPGTFTLFQNKKTDNDKAPQYKGQINIDGKTFYLSAWVKKDKNGNSFLSGQFKEPYKGKGNTDEMPFCL